MIVHHEQDGAGGLPALDAIPVGRHSEVTRHRFAAARRLCWRRTLKVAPQFGPGLEAEMSSAMSEDHSLRNGKAQSQTAEFPRDGALALLKGGENLRDLVRLQYRCRYR